MKKSFKRIIALVLALILAFSCMAVATVAADTEETTETQYDESHSFWQIFVDSLKTWWNYIRYIFYDVFLGKDAGTIPDAPTKHPVTYTAVSE